MKQNIEVEKYIRRIHNAQKKQYAWLWYDYRMGVRDNPESPKGLSVMGAQAVRMQIDEMLGVE